MRGVTTNVLLLGLLACAQASKQPWVEPRAPAHTACEGACGEDGPIANREAAPARDDQTDVDVGEVGRLVEAGHAAYVQGAYDAAETALKQAVQLDPFHADARVALGKVFLIRAAAQRDEALLESARLMFDMARTLDPEQREALLLLELFGRQVR